MPYSYIDPLTDSGEVLVKAIESTSSSFTYGRRNDDVVNWCLAKLIAYKEKHEEDIDVSCPSLYNDMIIDFENLKETLEDYQIDCLNYWEVDYDDKIYTCVASYLHHSINELRNLWIDQGGYPVPTV